MSVLSDNWLFEHGEEIFTPFHREQVNPASYDLKLDNRFVDLHTGLEKSADEITLSPPRLQYSERTGIYTLDNGAAVLASTWEYIRIPIDCCAAVFLKSSMARLGLDHALAGWVDPGFEGNLTLELHAHRDITLHAGQRVIQIVIYELERASAFPYHGKYKGQVGPTRAR